MLKNKVIVITGGAGLLGSEFSQAVLENNGIPIIADINESIMKEKIQLLADRFPGKSMDYFQLDITSRDSLNQCFKYVIDKYGKIDALVNNAYPRNKNYGRHFFDVEYKDFAENISLNLGGYFLASQQIANFFQSQKYGNIINISSIYGVVAPRFEIYEGTQMTTPVEYAAIKSALIHLTKYMAKYFKGLNIRVNCISPGGIFDGQPDKFLDAYNDKCLSKGMLDKHDIIGTLVYLLSDMSLYVNGQNIVVDDGFTL